jgi:hypothetical protein
MRWRRPSREAGARGEGGGGVLHTYTAHSNRNITTTQHDLHSMCGVVVRAVALAPMMHMHLLCDPTHVVVLCATQASA